MPRLAGPLGGHGTLQWASHIYPVSAAAGPPPALPFTPLPVPLGHSADFNFTSSFCSAACALGTQKPEFQVERENHLISWTLLAYESSSKMMEWKEGWEDIREWLNRRQSVPTTKLKSQSRIFFFLDKLCSFVQSFFKYAWALCFFFVFFKEISFWEAYELKMNRQGMLSSNSKYAFINIKVSI